MEKCKVEELYMIKIMIVVKLQSSHLMHQPLCVMRVKTGKTNNSVTCPVEGLA